MRAAEQISRVSITVSDLDRAEAFYRDALGFTCVARTLWGREPLASLLEVPDRRIAEMRMQLGAQTIEFLAFDPPGPPMPPDSTSSDLWFQHCAIVVGDMAEAYAQVSRFSVTPITVGGPQALPPNTGSVTAYKFRDPFGHPLELLAFPPGIGDTVWHEAGDTALFKGIDHTAIAVGDAARSKAFYERTLGLRASPASRNTGPEQSALDGLAGDRVDVVALAARHAPPHLELLGYPAGLRRPRPSGWQHADVACTRTVFEINDTSAVEADLAARGTKVRRGQVDGRLHLACQDPDGHSLIITAVRP